MGEGCGFRGNGQFIKIHPLALSYLILAGADFEGERMKTTDEVEVRKVIVVGQTMLLTEGDDRLELWEKNKTNDINNNNNKKN